MGSNTHPSSLQLFVGPLCSCGPRAQPLPGSRTGTTIPTPRIPACPFSLPPFSTSTTLATSTVFISKRSQPLAPSVSSWPHSACTAPAPLHGSRLPAGLSASTLVFPHLNRLPPQSQRGFLKASITSCHCLASREHLDKIPPHRMAHMAQHTLVCVYLSGPFFLFCSILPMTV